MSMWLSYVFPFIIFVVLFYILSFFSEHNLLSICYNLFFCQKILI